MASKRHQRRRACAEKRGHASMAAAIAEAQRLRARFLCEDFDAYHCRGCGSFHVGHRQKSMRNRLAAKRGE